MVVEDLQLLPLLAEVEPDNNTSSRNIQHTVILLTTAFTKHEDSRTSINSSNSRSILVNICQSVGLGKCMKCMYMYVHVDLTANSARVHALDLEITHYIH